MSEDRILDFRIWIWEGIEHRERRQESESRIQERNKKKRTCHPAGY
jgi:hypothetical protein